MPRIVKDLPLNRSDYTFGDLVYWHLYKFGTRPDIDPDADHGIPWEPSAIAGLLGISDKTLRNWIWDKNRPESSGALANELFGKNPRWNAARAELKEKLEQAWKRKTAAGTAPEISEEEVVEPGAAEELVPEDAADEQAGGAQKPEAADDNPPTPLLPALVKMRLPAPPMRPPSTRPRYAAALRWVAAASLAAFIAGFVWYRWPQDLRLAELMRPNPVAPSAKHPPAPSTPIVSPAPNPTPPPPQITTLPVDPPVMPSPRPLPTDEPRREPPTPPVVSVPAEKAVACIVGEAGLRELFATGLRRTIKGRIETGDCSAATGGAIVHVSGIGTTPRAGSDCDTPDKHVYELALSVSRPGTDKDVNQSTFGSRCSSRNRDADFALEREAKNQAVLLGVISLRQFLQSLSEP